MAKARNPKKRAPFQPPPDGRDVLMTPEDVMEVLKLDSIQQVYKLNSQNAFPVHKIGKHCRYFYSQVMTYVMNCDTRIKDNKSLHRKYTIDELPNCLPVKPSVAEDEVA